MKVLVIGGGQFNGYHLVRQLLTESHSVTVLNRGITSSKFPEGVESLIADRTDPEAMKSALSGREFDCVQDMCAYHPNDVEMIIDLLSGRVGHYIFASSTAIYARAEMLPISEESPVEKGGGQNEYGLHKILCEEILFEAFAEKGFPATSVPFSMVMGTRNIIPDREQRMIARILSGRPVLVPGDGTTLSQVGDVRDQSRALCLLMGRTSAFGKRYNLTGREYFSDLGYIHTFEKVLGKEAQTVHIPAEIMDALWDGEIPLDPNARSTDVKVDIRSTQNSENSEQASPEQAARQLMTARYMLANLVQRLSPNIHRWNENVFFSTDRLLLETGFIPEFDLEETVSQVYEWMKLESIEPDFNWTLEDQIKSLI